MLENSYANENDLTRERKQLADLKVELERARGRLEYQSKQIEQIERRLGSGEGEVQSLNGQIAERAHELEAHGTELEGLDRECGTLREELDAKSAERQQAQSHLAERDRALEGLRQGVLRTLGEASGLKNRITQLEAHLSSADREKSRAENEEKQSESDLARIQRLKAEISDRLQLRQTDLISVKDQRTAIEEELAATRAALRENRQTLDHQKSEFSRIKARKDSLEELIQHRSYTTETVKRLFTAAEKGKVHNLQPARRSGRLSRSRPAIGKSRGRVSARGTRVRHRSRLGGSGARRGIHAGGVGGPSDFPSGTQRQRPSGSRPASTAVRGRASRKSSPIRFG